MNLGAIFAIPQVYSLRKGRDIWSIIDTAILVLPLYVFLPKLILYGMKADTDAAI